MTIYIAQHRITVDALFTKVRNDFRQGSLSPVLIYPGLDGLHAEHIKIPHALKGQAVGYPTANGLRVKIQGFPEPLHADYFAIPY